MADGILCRSVSQDFDGLDIIGYQFDDIRESLFQQDALGFLGALVGATVGLCSGLLIAFLKLPSFVTTLAAMTIARGAALIASKPQATLKLGKAAFYAQAEMTLDESYAFAAETMTMNMLNAEACEGIGAFVEKTLVHSGQCTLVDPEARAAAVGIPQTWKQAFYARDLAGTVVLVGVPHPDAKVPDIPLIDVFGRGGALKSSWYGDCLPSRDFPMLVDLYRQGRLDLDAFVTEEVGLGDVEEAFEKMHGGDVLRSVVIL